MGLLILTLLLAACGFDATVPATTRISCDENLGCPPNFVCRPRFGVCVARDSSDREAPRVLSGSITPQVAGRGTKITATVTMSERLAQAPVVSIVQANHTVFMKLVEDRDGTMPSATFEHIVNVDDEAGTATVVVDAVDLGGNESLRLVLGTVTLDFVGPRVLSANFLAPRTSDGGALAVRSVEPIAVRVVLSEPLAQTGALHVVSTCDAGAAFTLASQAPGLVDFSAPSAAGLHGCEYGLELQGAIDLGGNALEGSQTLTARYRIDNEAPNVSGLKLLRPDGGPATVASHVTGFERFDVSFDIDDVPTGLTGQLDEVAISGCDVTACTPRDGGLTCRCQTSVGAQALEGSRIVSVTTRDEAGNVRTASIPVTFDFTPPALVGTATRVVLTPAATCPLQTISALGAGATARLFFATNEPATVSLASSPELLAFVEESNTGTTFVFSHTLDGGFARSVPLDVTLQATDLVGNTSMATLIAADAGALRIDTQAPNAVATTTAQVLFRRAPWGDETGTPKFEVIADAGTVPNNAVVRIVDGPTLDTAAELGRVQADGQGGFTATLQRSDRNRVYLSTLDDACNASTPADVKDVEWIATMGNKVRGSTLENPHRYLDARAFVPSIHQSYGSEVADSSGVARLGQGALSNDARAIWAPRANTNRGPQTTLAAAAYDSVRDRVTVVGGNWIDGAHNDMWEFDGAYWAQLQPADPEGDGDPERRYLATLVFDSVRRKLVLFGGVNGRDLPLGDTWEWDGVSWALRSTTGPAPRHSHGAAFDSRTGAMVVFGGTNGPTNFTDTWTWDGATWRRVMTPAAPTARTSGRMTYDSVNQRVVLFGGETTMGVSNETWLFDGTTWTKPSLSLSPSARTEASLNFDGQQVVLFGGTRADGSGLTDVWNWNGSGWTQLLVTAPVIQPQNIAVLDRRGRLIVEGGAALFSFPVDETFILERSGTPRWTSWAPEYPTRTIGMAGAFDPRRGTTVLFGGEEVGHASPTRTWEWDGTTFRQLRDAGAPTDRLNGLATYDPSRGGVVLMGGTNQSGSVVRSDTWALLDGGWRALVSTGAPMPAGNGLVADPVRNVLTLFGVQTQPQTWEFGATSTWQQRSTSMAPTARRGARMVWDSRRSRLLMFGGWNGAPLDELWSWDGANWALVTTTSRVTPPGREAATVFYDAQRDRLVLSGGNGAQGPLNDTWEFDGTNWERDESTVRPTVRSHAGFAYDSARRVGVMFGGRDDNVQYDQVLHFHGDLWEYRLSPADPAGQVMRVSFSAAGAESNATVHAVSAKWVAGGTGASGPGVKLWVADRGAYLAEANGTGGPMNPSTLTWQSTDASRLPRLFEGAAKELGFAVTPASGNGTQPSGVTVDYAEVRVRYRRP